MRLIAVSALLCIAAAAIAQTREASPMPGDCRIVNGRVDRGTCVG